MAREVASVVIQPHTDASNGEADADRELPFHVRVCFRDIHTEPFTSLLLWKFLGLAPFSFQSYSEVTLEWFLYSSVAVQVKTLANIECTPPQKEKKRKPSQNNNYKNKGGETSQDGLASCSTVEVHVLQTQTNMVWETWGSLQWSWDTRYHRV